MTGPMSDEQLMAFLHGELDEEGLATVEAALAVDPDLERRAEELAAQDQAIREAFAPILEAEIPSHLRAIVERDTASNVVVDFAAAKARRQPTAWSWPQFTAIAASLAIGIFAGSGIPGMGGSTEGNPFAVSSDGGLAVAGQVGTALSSTQSGKPVQVAAFGEVNVAITFKAHDGRVCRQFSLRSSAQVDDAVACREGGNWELEALGRRPAGIGEMRTAAGEAAPAVVATVDVLIAGEPLLGQAEKDALQ